MEFTVPLVFDASPIGLDGFIIENLQIDGVSAFIEVRHDAVVGGEAMLVVFGLEWFHQDGFGVDVK